MANVVRLTEDILLNDPVLKRKVLDLFNQRTFVDNIPRSSVVHLDTRCHKWTGGKVGEYGLLSITHNGIIYKRRAHIISYILHIGPAGNHHVLHLCQAELCFRPDHLKLGGPILNGKHASMNRNNINPLNKSWKLTTDEVKQIRHLYYRYNFTPKELAKMFNVTTSTIYKKL